MKIIFPEPIEGQEYWLMYLASDQQPTSYLKYDLEGNYIETINARVVYADKTPHSVPNEQEEGNK